MSRSKIFGHWKNYNDWNENTKRTGKCYSWNHETNCGWLEYRDKQRPRVYVNQEQLSDLRGFLDVGEFVRFNAIETVRGPFAIKVELIQCHKCQGFGHIQIYCDKKELAEKQKRKNEPESSEDSNNNQNENESKENAENNDIINECVGKNINEPERSQDSKEEKGLDPAYRDTPTPPPPPEQDKELDNNQNENESQENAENVDELVDIENRFATFNIENESKENAENESKENAENESKENAENDDDQIKTMNLYCAMCRKSYRLKWPLLYESINWKEFSYPTELERYVKEQQNKGVNVNDSREKPDKSFGRMHGNHMGINPPLCEFIAIELKTCTHTPIKCELGTCTHKIGYGQIYCQHCGEDITEIFNPRIYKWPLICPHKKGDKPCGAKVHGAIATWSCIKIH